MHFFPMYFPKTSTLTYIHTTEVLGSNPCSAEFILFVLQKRKTVVNTIIFDDFLGRTTLCQMYRDFAQIGEKFCILHFPVVK